MLKLTNFHFHFQNDFYPDGTQKHAGEGSIRPMDPQDIWPGKCPKSNFLDFLI